MPLQMPNLTASTAPSDIWDFSLWQFHLVSSLWAHGASIISLPRLCRLFLPRRIEPRAAHVVADATLHIPPASSSSSLGEGTVR